MKQFHSEFVIDFVSFNLEDESDWRICIDHSSYEM